MIARKRATFFALPAPPPFSVCSKSARLKRGEVTKKNLGEEEEPFEQQARWEEEDEEERDALIISHFHEIRFGRQARKKKKEEEEEQVRDMLS